MTDEIPQWALKLAVKKCGLAWVEEHAPDLAKMGVGKWETPIECFARYIAQHEEPPVDPLLIEARELAAKHYEQVGSYILADATRSGERDSLGLIKVIAEALRRGIELGKAGAA